MVRNFPADVAHARRTLVGGRHRLDRAGVVRGVNRADITDPTVMNPPVKLPARRIPPPAKTRHERQVLFFRHLHRLQHRPHPGRIRRHRFLAENMFARLGLHPAAGLSDAPFDLFPYSLQVSLDFAELLFDVADEPRRAFQRLDDRLHGRIVFQTKLFVVDLLGFPLDEFGLERRRQAPFQRRRQRPILHGLKCADIFFALTNQPNRHRLHTPRAQTAPHLGPQKGADLIADQTVEHPARLLRLVLLGVELDRPGNGRQDRLLGDLVEQDAVNVAVRRPHFLGEDLYLRLVVPPGYFISELVLDHWPSQNSASFRTTGFLFVRATWMSSGTPSLRSISLSANTAFFFTSVSGSFSIAPVIVLAAR